MSGLRLNRAVFVPSPQGMRALATSGNTEKVLEGLGEAVADRARQNGGRFSRRRWYTETSRSGSEVTVRAGTDQPAAHWDEWGNIYRQPRAPLRRALMSLGLWSKTREAGK